MLGKTSVAKYMAAEATAVPGLGDLSAQPCRRDRRDGCFRGADDFVPASVWLANPVPRSAPNLMAGGYRCTYQKPHRAQLGGPPYVRRLVSGRFWAMAKRRNEHLTKQKSVCLFSSEDSLSRRRNSRLPEKIPCSDAYGIWLQAIEVAV